MHISRFSQMQSHINSVMHSDLPEIMRSLKSTKRPARRLLEASCKSVTCETLHATYNILQHIETDCGNEIWHIKLPIIVVLLDG